VETVNNFNGHGRAATFERRQRMVQATDPDALKAAAVLTAINSYFTDSARRRGQDPKICQRIVRVVATEKDGWLDLQGVVFASNGISHSCLVRFRGNNPIWDSSCTCNISKNCPHSWAVADNYHRRLAGSLNSRAERTKLQQGKNKILSPTVSRAANQQGGVSAPDFDTRTGTDDRSEKVQSGSVSKRGTATGGAQIKESRAKEALTNLLNALHDKSKVGKASSEPFLAINITYHIDLDASGRLRLLILSTCDAGEQLAKRRMRPAQLLELAQDESLIEDALIARLILASIREIEEEFSYFPPDQKQSNNLLRQLLATGRLYWGSDENRALSEGESKPAEFAWAKTNAGHRLTIKLVGADVWAVNPSLDGRPTDDLCKGDLSLNDLSQAILGEEDSSIDDCKKQIIIFLDYALWYLDSSLGILGPLEPSPPITNSAIAALRLMPPMGDDELPFAVQYLQAVDQGLLLPLPTVDNAILEELRDNKVCLSVLRAPDTTSGARTFSLNDSEQPILTVRAGESWIDSRSRHAIVDCLQKLGFERCQSFDVDCDDDVVVLRPINHGSISTFARLQTHMEALGWNVLIDKSECRSVIDATAAHWTAQASDAFQPWFDFSLGITVDGTRYPLFPIIRDALSSLGLRPIGADIERLNSEGIFYSPLPDGQLLALPFERVKNMVSTLIQLFDESGDGGSTTLKVSVSQAMSLLSGDSRIEFEDLAKSSRPDLRRLIDLAHGFKKSQQSETTIAPSGLTATLRQYQQSGLRWLQFLREAGVGGVLADDMGLGKTVQALAHILLEKEEGRLTVPFLVICPTSLVPNWLAEAKKLTPDLSVLGYHGASRQSRLFELDRFDVVVTSYQTVLRDISILEKFSFYGVLLDEAQAIKNSSGKVRQAIFKLKCLHKISLTGTPIENHLGEIWSHFDFLVPGLLGSLSHFNSCFRYPIERERQTEKRTMLASLLRPLILRRNKNEVASELPSKSIIFHEIEMDETQRDLYETVRVSVKKEVAAEVDRKGLHHSRITILSALMKLRQVCCDPRLVKTIDGTSQVPSAKLAALLELLIPLVEDGRRILIFSQFTSMLDIIASSLVQHGIDFVELRGDTKDRATPVNQFQNGQVPVFLISLKAGGVGLNLTAADTVIHYDPWWNPAVEDQATDRAHRIGQDKPVFVYKLIARGTVEEAMLAMQQKKRELTADFLGHNQKESALTPTELENLLSEVL
jgi:superfamily II DNA or RNA helicase